MKTIIKIFTVLTLIFSCNSKKTNEKLDLEESIVPSKVLVEITDNTYKAPDSIAIGIVNIELSNKSSGMHSAHLIKLDDGFTTPQLIKAYADSMRTGGERPKWMTHRGGVISEPGTSNITLALEPGNYTWVCVMGTDSLPHFAGHEHKAVKVFGDINKSGKLAEPDVIVKMTDDNFEINKPIVSGQQSLEVINTGTKYHLTAISKLNQEATAKDLMNWFTTYNGPPPAQGIIATSAIGPELSGRIDINFDPGNYVIYCMANAEGKFHLLDGAITEFTVK